MDKFIQKTVPRLTSGPVENDSVEKEVAGPSEGRQKHPNWIRDLMKTTYFELNSVELRANRKYFVLECLICREELRKKDEKAQSKLSLPAKPIQPILITSKDVASFSRHLEVS